MSIITDRKFALLLGAQLPLFTQKSENLWNFRCPFCGDSQKNKYRARGYLYRKEDRLVFHCHNCAVHGPLVKLIDQIDHDMAAQYRFEIFQEKKIENHSFSVPTNRTGKINIQTNQKLSVPTIEHLPETHPAKLYLQKRLIPNTFFDKLYFTENFREFIEQEIPQNEHKDAPADGRIIIPFYNENKVLIGVQGRALSSIGIRYITLKARKNEPKIFGLDRVDKSKKVYALEGPFNSMFIPNSLAMMDSSLFKVRSFDIENSVLIFDNEPRKKETIQKMERAQEQDLPLVVWPSVLSEYNDINDMVIGGVSPKELLQLIDQNTFSGLRAKLEISKWKRI